MASIFQDNSRTIGNTPLIKLNKLAAGHNILVKAESQNPANSVKCRIGASMIWDAESSGKLNPGMELIEPTSGNTGIALAFVASSRDIPITLTMPASMSLERRKVMKALGANLILTEPSQGMPGAIAKAKKLAETEPDKYLLLQQFENPANPKIHEETTGPEIWDDTGGAIDVLVAGVGTGGTISGISRYIKATQGKPITSIAVEPSASPVISQTLNGQAIKPAPHKIQGIGAGFVPKNLDLTMVDDVEQVSNEEAMETALKLMQQEGILTGISGGAALAAALKVANKSEHEGKMIVVILPDSGERYLSTPLFEGVFSEAELVQ